MLYEIPESVTLRCSFDVEVKLDTKRNCIDNSIYDARNLARILLLSLLRKVDEGNWKQRGVSLKLTDDKDNISDINIIDKTRVNETKRTTSEMIFLGSGYYSAINISNLKERLNEAIIRLSGLQQTGDENKEDYDYIENVAKDIYVALTNEEVVKTIPV